MQLREWIGLALVILGLARASLLVAHDPLVGYANQYDMMRTSACLGLFPDLPEPARYQPHPEAPIPGYRTQDVRRDLCYLSTEVAIVAATATVTRAASFGKEVFKVRWVGFAKLALFAVTALALAWAFHPHPAAALYHGVIVCVLLCDPVVTLWYNTFYTEFAAIWTLYAAIGAITALAITERGAIALAILLAISLAGLAFSREQLALLGPAIVLVSWPWLWQRSPPATIAALAVALIASVISFGLVQRPEDVKQANRVDAYMGVALPAASDPKAAMAALGLPDRCEALLGASFLNNRGEPAGVACPEALKLSPAAFVRVGREEPLALARAVARVLPGMQEVVPNVGTVAGANREPVNRLPWWLKSPLHALAWRLPLTAYVAMVIAVALAAPLGMLAALGWASPSRTQHGTEILLAMLLGVVTLYALATTVFGDGFSEASRHFITGNLAVYSGWIGVAFAIPALAMRWVEAPKQRVAEMIATLLAVAAIAAGASYAMGWARTQPLAIGLLDQPVGRNVVPGAALKVSGWALDPSGIDSVVIRLGKIERAAALGEPSPAVKVLFPSYPGADKAGFEAQFTADEVAQAAASAGPVSLRALARSRAGPAMEIDRRELLIPRPASQ